MPKLSYLDKQVKGEALRLALAVGGVDFVDERVSYEEIAARRQRKELPFSQVPTLEVDGVVYAQSGAILRWAGRRGGLYPEAHMLRIDSVVETIADLWPEMIKVGYGSAMLRNPINGVPMVRLTSQQRLEAAKMCHDVLFPTRFQQLERVLGNAQPFFCGEELTIADIAVYAMASQILDGMWSGNGVTPDVLAHCPKLRALVQRVGEHPRVRQWYEQYAARYGADDW